MRKTLFFLCSSLLVACYDPKPDIDKQRPRATAKLDAMVKVGSAVSALPPLEADTMAYAKAADVRFGSDKPNAAIVHLEELTDIGSSKIYNRLINDDFWRAPVTLLKEGRDPYISKLDAKLISERFERLFDLEYLVVLRTPLNKTAEMKDQKQFVAGELRGEAFFCTMDAACFGGFSYSGVSSEHVSAMVKKDREKIDMNQALRADIEKKARGELTEKLKKALPEATLRAWY